MRTSRIRHPISDWLARSTKNALHINEQLDRTGAWSPSPNDSTSPMGRMMFRLLFFINEFEKDQLAQRTRSVMAHLRQQNRRISAKIPWATISTPTARLWSSTRSNRPSSRRSSVGEEQQEAES